MAYYGDRVASSGSQITSVTGSVTGIVLLYRSPGRTGLTVFNDTNQTAYLAMASSASRADHFTTKVAAQSSYELPQGRIYWGPVVATWQTAPTTGSLLVTEYF